MPSMITKADREVIRRSVPKPTTNILAATVARLYVAYPNLHQWVYTGLQGAVILADDTVGHTLWIKLVDISPAGRGVLWDQEIYEGFPYHQDRTFFHTFELEQCPAGLCFADDGDAQRFFKKLQDRDNLASKETRQSTFSSNGPANIPIANGRGGGRSLFGNLLHRGATINSAPPPPSVPPTAPVRTASPLQKAAPFDTADPSWKDLLDELLAMGITEDQIRENEDFIRSYIEQKQADGVGGDSAAPAASVEDQRRAKAPPPPPPPIIAAPPPRGIPISPQNTGSNSGGRRAAPPPPPPSRRARQEVSPGPSEPGREPTPSPRDPSPPRPRFRAPPPIADAGKFAHLIGPVPPVRQRAASGSAPPPPPRPPKAPLDDNSPPRFSVSFILGERKVSAPPAPPSRSLGHAPPPPPPREPSPQTAPQLPPKTPTTASSIAVSPLPPARGLVQPPPPPPSASRPPVVPIPPLPSPQDLPPHPPPPPPATSIIPPPPPPPPPTTSTIPPPPPPPPLPTSGVPLPPPPPVASVSPSLLAPGGAAPPLPQLGGGRDDLLAAIRASGGRGGGTLRKVQDSEKKDRSGAMVPGGTNDVPAVTAPPGGVAGPQGLASAFQDALAKRKQKVSGSDDERDEDDDW